MWSLTLAIYARKGSCTAAVYCVPNLPIKAVRGLKDDISRLFAEIEAEEPRAKEKHAKANGNASDKESVDDVVKMQEDLKRFMRYLWHAPYVRISTPYNRAQLKHTIQAYLIAHLTQTEDNVRLANQPSVPSGEHKIYDSPATSLYGWTHSTSGDHTAGPMAVSAFFCMLGQGADCLPSARAKYIAQNTSRHLAALCRLYNDYGSVARDREESNLNSVNFPEFRGVGGDAEVKKELSQVAEYERRCLVASLAELRPLVREDVFVTLRIFYNSADMYGQMYVLKDLTPSVKVQGQSGGK